MNRVLDHNTRPTASAPRLHNEVWEFSLCKIKMEGGIAISTYELPWFNDIYDKISHSCSCSCIMEDTSKISAFCGWMKGSGKAKFSNRSDGYYKARVANQISFDKVLRGYDLRTFSIQLSCGNCTAKKPSPMRELLRLGRLDSNQRMRESKSRALPLGDAPPL